MATIGQQLAGAREEAGISIEDAAHDTRIHPNMILSIEEDDFSMFPSVAYARSFIRNYSDYLDVDLSHEMEALDSSVTGRLSENELMNEMKKTIKKESRFRLKRNPGRKKRRPVEKAGGSPIFLNLLLLLLIGALGVFYFLGYRASTPEEARTEITKGLNRINIFAEEGSQTEQTEQSEIPENPLRGNEKATTEEAAPEVAETMVDDVPTEPELIAEPVAETPATTDSSGSGENELIAKPNIDIDLEETPDPSANVSPSEESVAMSPLRPRGGAELNFGDGVGVTPSIRSEDMPAVLRSIDEPEAALRPEGTSPASPSQADSDTRQRSVSFEDPALRALPVRR